MSGSALRILLDACVPLRLARELRDFGVRHTSELGWGRLGDGELLEVMTGRFDALVTVDKGIRHQQRIADRPFAVVLLRAPTNRPADLLPLVPILRATLKRSVPGEHYEISRNPEAEDR